jgi:hypothetical protein
MERRQTPAGGLRQTLRNFPDFVKAARRQVCKPLAAEKHVPRRRLAHCASISGIGATTLRLLGIARVPDYVFPRVCRRPGANHRALYAARALSVCTNERHETIEDKELCVLSQPAFGAKSRVDRNENYKSTTNA